MKREKVLEGKSGITPGGPTQEEYENFDHEYYKFSMKIIDLLLQNKKAKIEQMGLDKQVFMKELFYEEPVIEDGVALATMSTFTASEL